MEFLQTTEAFRSLLDLDSAEQLEGWLKLAAGPDVFGDSANWKLVGNQTSNAGAIEQSPDDINPLIERIVNGMEAVVELRRMEDGSRPENPADAIQSLFRIPEGKSRLLDETAAQRMAGFVTMTLRGRNRTNLPTIDIRDVGIGLHPDEFADTILALGQSTKGRQPHLIGMYGQGGSSTFDKCEYTVIVSRKAASLLSSNQQDAVGWTVVRKTLNVRAPEYSYFVDKQTDSVPRFSSPAANDAEFNHGTLVMHIGYKNLGAFSSQRITNNAFYTLNFRLFDPILPWTLVDARGGERTARTMRGVPYRISQLPSVIGIGATAERRRTEATAIRHHMEYRHRRSGDSNLRVAWWILQDEQAIQGRRRRAHAERLRPYRDHSQRYSRRVIAVTRGGQTHAALTPRTTLLRKGFRQLARGMIVQIDTDDLTWEEVADFFTSNRADLKTASHEYIEDAINAAIGLHESELRAIERERQAELVSGRSASDQDEIKRHLDPLIRAFLRTQGRSNGGGAGGGRTEDFRGRQVPTFFRFARSSTLSVRPGVPTRAQLLLDAFDEVVKHPRTEIRIQSNNPDIQIGPLTGQNGRYTFGLTPSPDLVPGARAEIVASISQPGTWMLNAENPLRLLVNPPPDPFVGESPPTHIRFRSQNGAVHVRQGGGRFTIRTDARNDLLDSGAQLEIESPDPDKLPILGWSGPSDGEIRVNIEVPIGAELGPAGELLAILSLASGSQLDDIASLGIDKPLSQSGEVETETAPNYEIKDVVEIPKDPGETSWSEMPNILDGSDRWTEKDVGAYLETESDGDRKITFYLNAANKELEIAERQIADRSSEAAVDSFRIMHRTLLCFHLYKLATNQPSDAENQYTYRDEMIRVSQTLTFTHGRFVNTVVGDEMQFA